RRPLIRVPFKLPRSRTATSPSTSARQQCRRETRNEGSRTSQSGWRPTTIGSRSTGMSGPSSRETRRVGMEELSGMDWTEILAPDWTQTGRFSRLLAAALGGIRFPRTRAGREATRPRLWDHRDLNLWSLDREVQVAEVGLASAVGPDDADRV